MDIKEQIKKLPNQAGIYQYFDKNDIIIYIGKAKNLKKRVSSYFNKKNHDIKTHTLVKHIKRVEYIVVNNEIDAFHLENSYIKKHKPKYNILLKDSKTYPYIAISKERFPKVFMTRKVETHKNHYFGPFVSSRMIKNLIQLFEEIFFVRDCAYDLSQKNIDEGKYKACLKFHLKKCKAPCVGKQTLAEYDENISLLKKVMNVRFNDVKNILKEKRDKFAEELKFERAQGVQEQLQLLEQFFTKSLVVNPSYGNLDVFNYYIKDKTVFICYLKIVKGCINLSYIQEVQNKHDDPIESILSASVFDMREKFSSDAREIIVPIEIEEIPNAKSSVPQIGDKTKLLALALKNISYLKKTQTVENKPRYMDTLEKMKKDLELTELPYHIECFDNSNLQGTNPVSSCVVFKNAKPSKKDYRLFNVKTVEGPDDFATMKEVVRRRYYRLITESKPLPQLIVVDGGKGQLSSSYEILKELGIENKVAIIGIAKRLEEIFKPEDSIPLYIDKNSISLKIIQHLRDEAHRFGITFHRKQRSKSMVNSELDYIKGIGEKTKTALLKVFKTVENIKSAQKEDLSQVVGLAKAQLILEFFEKN
jgi:excinuclease ABC subunit C